MLLLIGFYAIIFIQIMQYHYVINFDYQNLIIIRKFSSVMETKCNQPIDIKILMVDPSLE